MKRMLLLLVIGLFILPGRAHEVSTNRATLVLREANHIALTLRVNLSDLMRDVLTPKMAPNEFLAQFSAMPSPDFEMHYARVQTLVQSETRMFLPSGRNVPLGQWRWPNAKQVQANIRDSAMQMAVAPLDHLPEFESEVHAEATAGEDLSDVSLQLPRQLRPILIVNYRPHQVWMKPPNSEVRLRF